MLLEDDELQDSKKSKNSDGKGKKIVLITIAIIISILLIATIFIIFQIIKSNTPPTPVVDGLTFQSNNETESQNLVKENITDTNTVENTVENTTENTTSYPLDLPTSKQPSPVSLNSEFSSIYDANYWVLSNSNGITLSHNNSFIIQVTDIQKVNIDVSNDQDRTNYFKKYTDPNTKAYRSSQDNFIKLKDGYYYSKVDKLNQGSVEWENNGKTYYVGYYLILVEETNQLIAFKYNTLSPISVEENNNVIDIISALTYTPQTQTPPNQVSQSEINKRNEVYQNFFGSNVTPSNTKALLAKINENNSSNNDNDYPIFIILKTPQGQSSITKDAKLVAKYIVNSSTYTIQTTNSSLSQKDYDPDGVGYNSQGLIKTILIKQN